MDRANRKVRVGIVVSDSRDKTVTVEIRDAKRHPRYGKTVPVRTKLHAHDESNDANVGDTVRIVETRPLSKSKRWRLEEILERAR
ncbi:MAG: 30S ribosomal protein S17 [Acidimicrobiia bacterium]|nr:MAG: 30S ribosomal protein S17 [Acidimicrobiia bacterium]